MLMSAKAAGVEQIESVSNICQFIRNSQSVFVTRFPLLSVGSAQEPSRTAPSFWLKLSGCYAEVCVNPNQVIHLS